MFRIETVNDKLILTFITNESATAIPLGSKLVYSSTPLGKAGVVNEKMGVFGHPDYNTDIYWPQPDDKMGKSPLVIITGADGSVNLKNLTEIALPTK
jgi:hypothetical protein